MGWSEVAGGGVTDVPLAAAPFEPLGYFAQPGEAELFLFAKGIDDRRVYVNAMRKDYEHMTKDLVWTKWSEVAGGGVTDVPLAAASFKNTLFLFGKGIDDKGVYVNKPVLHVGWPPVPKPHEDMTWTGWSGIGGTTDVGLSAVAAFGKLFLFRKGIDKRIYSNRTTDGDTWEGWVEVEGNGTTDVSLSVAKDDSPRLYLFAKGIDDMRVYVNTTNDGIKWTGWSGEIGGTTDVALTACTTRAAPNQGVSFGVEVFAKGLEDNKIYKNTMIPQMSAPYKDSFHGWEEVGGSGTTDVALACTRFGEIGTGRNVYLFRKGIDRKIYVNINP